MAFATGWAWTRFPEKFNTKSKRGSIKVRALGLRAEVGAHATVARADNGRVCTTCGLSCRTDSGLYALARRPCRGTIVDQADATHTLKMTCGFTWCVRCGAHAVRFPRMLLRPCPGRPRSEAQGNCKRRLQAGLPPTAARRHLRTAREHAEAEALKNVGGPSQLSGGSCGEASGLTHPTDEADPTPSHEEEVTFPDDGCLPCGIYGCTLFRLCHDRHHLHHRLGLQHAREEQDGRRPRLRRDQSDMAGLPPLRMLPMGNAGRGRSSARATVDASHYAQLQLRRREPAAAGTGLEETATPVAATGHAMPRRRLRGKQPPYFRVPPDVQADVPCLCRPSKPQGWAGRLRALTWHGRAHCVSCHVVCITICRGCGNDLCRPCFIYGKWCSARELLVHGLLRNLRF